MPSSLGVMPCEFFIDRGICLWVCHFRFEVSGGGLEPVRTPQEGRVVAVTRVVVFVVGRQDSPHDLPRRRHSLLSSTHSLLESVDACGQRNGLLSRALVNLHRWARESVCL